VQPAIRDETAVLQAIADLLLGALGRPIEERAHTATAEVSHELEDYI
jgi:hypothetical protein